MCDNENCYYGYLVEDDITADMIVKAVMRPGLSSLSWEEAYAKYGKPCEVCSKKDAESKKLVNEMNSTENVNEKELLVKLSAEELSLIKKYLLDMAEIKKRNVYDDLSLDDESKEEEIEEIEKEVSSLIKSLEAR